MKVGDLVRVKIDPDTWLVHGVVLAMAKDEKTVRVRGFDVRIEQQDDWNTIVTREAISERRRCS